VRLETHAPVACEAAVTAQGGGAGAPIEPAPKRRSPKPRSSQQKRRNWLVIVMRAAGMTWSEIVAIDGRSRGPLEAVVKRHREKAREDPESVMDQTPEELLRLLVGRYEMTRQIALRAVSEAQSASELVGAAKALLQVQQELRDLLTVVGRLPADLSSLKHVLDLRRISAAMLDAMDAFRERTEALPAETKEQTDAAAREFEAVFQGLVGLTEDEPDDEVFGQAQLPPARS
jgi:hypothetical protein